MSFLGLDPYEEYRKFREEAARDRAEDTRQRDLFRSNPPHFLTVSAKENTTND